MHPLRHSCRRFRPALGAFLALALFFLLPGLSRAQVDQPFEVQDGDLFVAPNGDDHWSGTQPEPNGGGTDGPFATPARALQAIHDRHASGRLSPRILIRAGTYFLDKPLVFGPDDSGTVRRPLVVAAYPGEEPVLDGGVRLPGTWQKPEQGSIWTLQLPAGTDRIEDLFLNGKRLARARMPREGYWQAKAVDPQNVTQFLYDPAQLTTAPDLTGAVVFFKPYEWDDEILRIESVDATTHTVNLVGKSAYPLVSADAPGSGAYYIENVRAGLDQPGEWYFNPVTRLVSFWPPAGVDPTRAEIIAGGLPVMVSVKGDLGQGRWAEHIILEGLTFMHAGRYDTDEFLNGTAICFSQGVRDCEVRNCRFADLGGCGFTAFKECTGAIISGNEFMRTGDSPVKIFDYVSEEKPLSSGNMIENNSIHDCGTVIQHIAGVAMELTANNHVDHNLIYNMPYHGIELNGARPEYWEASESPGLAPPYTAASIKPFIPSSGNIVEFNYIHHVMQKLRDGGGVYFWGVMGTEPNFIRNNLIEHVGTGDGPLIGVYLDDDCDGVQVTDNIVNDANYGIHLHGASRDVLDNNIFAYSRTTNMSVQPEKYNVGPMNTVLRHNIFYEWKDAVFLDTSWAVWDRTPLAECDRNLFWQGGKKVALGAGTYAGFDQHSLVADPGFIDPAHGDFRLKNDSPAFTLGIHAIDLKGVGLTSKTGPLAESLPPPSQ